MSKEEVNPVLAVDDLAECPDKEEQQVTPWTAANEVDYDKLIRDFGCQHVTDDLITRCERLTGKPAHRFLRRGIFFSHRDLNKVLDLYEKGEPFYLYTGRGPSSQSMHTGHLVPFLFTKWLQETFNVPLVIQITDDEKFYFKDISVDEVEALAHENIRDIIALGFDKEKTFIFRDFEYIGHMYRTVARIEKATTASQVKGCFGFKGDDNVGKWLFPAIQAAPSFSVCFPHIFPDTKKNIYCLIPQAIDQDPYFRLTRDVANRLGYLKPALIHSKFFPGLAGATGKMSSSVGAAVFLTDTKKEITKKINSAFSGGGGDVAQQLEFGALCSVDVPIQWLGFFMEDDDEYGRIQHEYTAGRMMTGAVKKILIDELVRITSQHQESRKKVTDEVVKEFCNVRRIVPPQPCVPQTA
eukprot:Tbor_TRINITY_DN3939_c0_g1::TRINITY_DN3939_c0_g1_i1::g.873::m.873/K01867/WARS, trpS; tryptophanyl-tRNA synthetase